MARDIPTLICRSIANHVALLFYCAVSDICMFERRLKKVYACCNMMHKESRQRSQRSSMHFQHFTCIVVSFFITWLDQWKQTCFHFPETLGGAWWMMSAANLSARSLQTSDSDSRAATACHISHWIFSLHLYPASIRRQRPTQYKCIYSPLVVKHTHKQSTLQSE